MTLAEKRDELLKELLALPDPQSRLSHLVQVARDEPRLPSSLRTETYLLHGCLSRVWLVPSRDSDGLCHFRADSDSMMVRAVAGLLCRLYSGYSPQEILQVNPAFLSQAGITQHLTVNRRNGLTRVWETIEAFAQESLTPSES